jgi:hypothetical protein
MALTPTDMFSIQAAIEAYEKRFPHRPSPSAGEALSWQAGRRGVKPPSDKSTQSISGECGVWSSAWERLLFWWHSGRGTAD